MGFWAQAGAAMLGSLVLAVFTSIFGAMGYAVLVIQDIREEIRDLEDRIESVEAQTQVAGQLVSRRGSAAETAPGHFEETIEGVDLNSFTDDNPSKDRTRGDDDGGAET